MSAGNRRVFFYFGAKSHFLFLFFIFMRKVVAKGHLCKSLQIVDCGEGMPRFYIRSGDEAAVAAAAVALHVVLFVALVVLVAGLAHAREAVREAAGAVSAGDAGI